jgi:hypothetical protein
VRVASVALQVEADLRVSTDEGVVRILGERDRLVVSLGSLGVARALWRHRPNADLGRWTVRYFDAALRWAGIGVDIVLEDSVVGRLGWRARPSLLGRAAGIPELELRFFPLLGAVVKAVTGRSDRP